MEVGKTKRECKTFHLHDFFFACVQNNIKTKVHYLLNSEECHDFQKEHFEPKDGSALWWNSG